MRKITATTAKAAKSTVANVSNNEPKVVASAPKGKKASTKVLVKRTNVPWKRKFYHLDLKAYKASAEVIAKKASQIQLMLKYMAENEVTSAENSAQGGDICANAISKGYVKSKIDPPVLFAYYRKDMEQLGLVFSGYNMTK